MDKQTEEICKQGAKALADIYTSILEDMGIHVEKETPKEKNKPLGKRKSYPCPPSWLQDQQG